MNMELLIWGDGTTRLSFWDNIHGNDRHFILDESGAVFEEDENDVRQLVDFVAELRKMALNTI